MAVAENLPVTKLDSDLFTPIVETSVFEEQPNARFWVGRVAVLGDTLLENEYLAARQLRANVYIDKMGFLDESHRQADGGEKDADDDRSIQFAVLENRGEEKRVVGTSRLIVKRNEDDILPIERLFPSAFQNGAPVGSTEASRFIAEHPDGMTKHLVSLAGIRSMDLEALDRGYEPIYAVIEEKLAGMFKFIGIPFAKIADVEYLAEYESENMGVEIDPNKVKDEVTKDLISGELLLTQFFQDALESLGLGYYDEGLQKPIAA